MAEEYLKQADEELKKGDLKQASKKIWGAAALGVKAPAYARDSERLKSQGDLRSYIDKLVKEAEDEELGDLWRTATSTHLNLYEN